MSAPLAQALREYGAAFRGSWGDIDGRSVQGEMQAFASAVEGGPEAEWSLFKWRDDLGLCPDGGGHWSGGWHGFCETDEGCPSLREEGER